jgi:predicted FMN-binding regulatory protein PaiB
VRVRGHARLLDEQQTAWLLRETVAAFESRLPRPWQYNSGEPFLNGSAKGVAAFELVVDEIEAACKLSQDRSPEERTLIAAELERSERSDDQDVAAILRELDTAPRRPMTIPVHAPPVLRPTPIQASRP